MIKKIGLLCIAIVMMFTTTTLVSMAADEPSSWAKDKVSKAIELGHVPKELQGNYQEPITREEFATLFVTAILSDINETNDRRPEYTKEAWYFRELNVDNILSRVETSQKFEDTDNKYVKVANIFGIINGNSKTTFNPDGKITREQVATMVANYTQISTAPTWRYKEDLEDFDSVSSWAKQGVAYTYESGLMNGTRKAVSDIDGEYIQKGLFSGEELLTREQAIITIYRLGRDNEDYLDRVILRGFVLGNMDVLMSGIVIDGDTVKLKSSGYDNEYSDLNINLTNIGGRYEGYVSKYNSEKLNSIILGPPGQNDAILNENHLNRILNNEYLFYDYGCNTVEYNKDGYLVVVTKADNEGYFAYAGYLAYGNILLEDGIKAVTLINYKDFR